MIKDIESDTSNYFPSDHFPKIIKLKYKLKKNFEKSNENTNKWKGAEKPTETSKEQYNSIIQMEYATKIAEKNAEDENNINNKMRALFDFI